MQHSRWRLLVLVMLAAVALSYAGFRLATVRSRPQVIPWYQGTAILGNGQLLVALDHYGTVTGIFWPRVGRYENIHNPHEWISEPGRTPPSTGAYLGIAYSGRVHWLRDVRVDSQMYREDSNLLVTRYTLDDGGKVALETWALPDRDTVIARVSITAVSRKKRYLVAYQNLDLGGERSNDQAVYRDGFLVQHRIRPNVAVAIGTKELPESWHLGEVQSFGAIQEGQFNRRVATQGDVISAARWPLMGSLSMVCAWAESPEEAVKQAASAVGTSPQELQRQERQHWRKWLTSGRAFGIHNTCTRRLYVRSLLVLKLLQDSEGGAVIAGARSYWSYCWPRDGVYAAVALDLAGHHTEARKLYRFLTRAQRTDGMWEARYHVDGTPVRDGRATQLDAGGYFLWGVWLHTRLTGDWGFAREMEPFVERAAKRILADLDRRTGLPGPSSDYWESSKHLTYYLSNAIVCWAGLTCASQLASRLWSWHDVAALQSGASRIRQGVRQVLWDGQKYVRAVEGFRGADGFTCRAISPFSMFSPDDAHVSTTVRRIEERLTTPRGGVVPGEDWTARDPWVHETLFLLLYHLAAGHKHKADRYFDWVHGAANEAGVLPERLSVETGLPNSTAPLGWAHAEYILATVARWGGGIPKPRR